MSRTGEDCASDFASSSDEDEQQQPRTSRQAFVVCEVFSTQEEAQIGIDMLDGYHYKFKHNYGNAGNGTRIYCWEAEDDSGAQFDVPRRGIHGALKREVDSILFGGAGPKKCRNLLFDRHANNPEILQHLPTHGQLKNRKAALRKKQSGDWEVHNFATLLEWAYSHLCTSKSEFVGHEDGASIVGSEEEDAVFKQKSRQFQHGVIALECFEHDIVDEDGKRGKSFGLVLTSRHAFRNLLKTHASQQDIGVLGVTDGTYKLHFDVSGWTLVDFGTYTTHYSRGQYSKTFVPWMYMFVKTEHQTAYTTMFRTAQRFARLFFDIDLTLSFGSLDRAQYIANAFKAVWPEIMLLNCYPHLVRKSRDKVKLLKVSTYYEDNVLPNIRYLSQGRSNKQFKALSKIVLQFWKTQGEADYAEWFENIYLGDTWGNWFYAAAAPGITPSQNAIETHHRVIKKVCVGSLRANTAVVLNDSIPRILGLQQSQPTRLTLKHFSEGPFVSEAVVRAQTLLQEKANYYVIKDTRSKVVKGILFNASKFVVSPVNIHGAVLDRTRATTYRNSIHGKLPTGLTVNTAELHCLSIHQVQLRSRDNLEDAGMISAAPSVSTRTTGWQCSHVIAAMTLQKDITIEELLKALLVRKLSDGQRKRVGPPVEGCDNTHRFSVDVLIREFLKYPARPLHWNLMREFKLPGEDGIAEEQFLLGKVISWGENDGVFFWMAKFSSGAQVKLECQDLAECLNRAYTHGADVAGAVAY